MSPLKLSFLACYLVLWAGVASAQRTSCSGSNANLSLGVYPSYNATAIDSSGSLVVSCTRSGGPQNVAVTVGIGTSFNSGNITNRQLKLNTGTDLLAYNLYRDALRLSVWGDTVGINTMTQSVSIPNNSSRLVTFSIFARINSLQDVRAGDYSDRAVITVTF